MALFEVGNVCIKLVGREAGHYCVVIKPAGKSKEEKSFVFITGPKLLTGVKRRKANINHLKATGHKLDVQENATDEQVLAAYDKAGLVAKLGLKKPSAAQMKAREEKMKSKEEAKTKEQKQKKVQEVKTKTDKK
jgi:large subunit ribosomal protein L14e